MSRYKKLKHSFPTLEEYNKSEFIRNYLDNELLDYYSKHEIRPVFNTPGWYYDRKQNTCWYETDFGTFIANDMIDSFKLQLELQNHIMLSSGQIMIIEEILLKEFKNFVNVKKLNRLLYIDSLYKEFRDNDRNNRLKLIKYINKK